MIDVNLVNFMTIGVIGFIFWALFKFVAHYFGINLAWAQ
jgi:hypothetical protein